MATKTRKRGPALTPHLTVEGLEQLLAEGFFEAVGERQIGSGVVRWAGNFESVFGYARGEIPESFEWWRQRVHPEDLARAERASAEATAGKAKVFSTEFRFRRKSGSWGWVSARSVVVRDERGKPTRVITGLIDITQFKETESRLRLFTEQIPARATGTDRNLRVVWDVGGAFPGSASAVGKTVRELFAESPDRDRVLDGCRKALAGESCELEIDDGANAAQLRLVPFRDPAGRIIGVIGIAFDITARVRSEEKARAGQLLLQQVLDTLPVGVIMMNASGDVVVHNPAAEDVWGRVIVEGDERWAKSKGFWHETGREIAADEWASRRALEDGAISREELIDIKPFDGQSKTIENFAAPIRDVNGAITGAVIVNQDVTERVRAEEALRKTERLLLDAERLGGTGSWEQDLITGEIFNNDASRRLFFGDDTSKGARLDDYADAVHPDDRERVMRSREALLAGTGSGDIEYRVTWPDGSEHVIFGRATVVRDDAGKAIRVYGTNADVTERKRAEDELGRRARQLETLSRKLMQAQEDERRAVARELHDDLGQVLFALKLNLQRSGRDEKDNIALVDGAIARMRDLVQALRPPLLSEMGLEAALGDYVQREAKRAGIAARLSLDPLKRRPSPEVETTCFRIAQEALTNVIRHAHATAVDVQLREMDASLQLTVRDDGHGFHLGAARRRSALGESHGLVGMRERVALVGGTLDVESATKKGTTIRATLPIAGA